MAAIGESLIASRILLICSFGTLSLFILFTAYRQFSASSNSIYCNPLFNFNLTSVKQPYLERFKGAAANTRGVKYNNNSIKSGHEFLMFYY